MADAEIINMFTRSVINNQVAEQPVEPTEPEVPESPLIQEIADCGEPWAAADAETAQRLLRIIQQTKQP